MKVPAILVSLALAGGAVAQLDRLPTCARSCATEMLASDIGGCGADIECICGNDQFLDDIACCLVDDCDEAAQSTAVSVAISLCSGFGVTDLPTAVTCADASASTTTSGPADTSATTTPAPTATDDNTAPTDTPDDSNDDANDSNDDASTDSTESPNYGPRQTAAAGLGAIGGIIAAVALL
ncbi:GPI anchored CFEM domain protein C [Madurella mycetomatis]|uniref:GPI anchored CFEM domain protein C n=1 Tax=Madurella mycetomatis TaxID=100816 RepID=A0A175WDL1_9PEZI|nr:GPI anchored CFEM domain protein C [Madurella mycetomatis]